MKITSSDVMLRVPLQLSLGSLAFYYKKVPTPVVSHTLHYVSTKAETQDATNR